jgi:hypothetical protein
MINMTMAKRVKCKAMQMSRPQTWRPGAAASASSTSSTSSAGADRTSAEQPPARTPPGWPAHPVLASLWAFLRAGLLPRTPIARAVILGLSLKLMVLVTLMVVLSGPDSHPAVDPQAMARRFGPTSP